MNGVCYVPTLNEAQACHDVDVMPAQSLADEAVTGEVEATEQPASAQANIEDLESTATSDLGQAPQPQLSKNQQRKLVRKERLAAEKGDRRAREKAARKDRKAEKRRLVEEEGADPYEIGLAKKRHKSNEVKRFDATVVVDLSFDDKMNEKDVTSMSTQLAHVYNANRHALRPINLIFTPLGGKLEKVMLEGRKGDYLRWKGLHILKTPLEALWAPVEVPGFDAAGIISDNGDIVEPVTLAEEHPEKEDSPAAKTVPHVEKSQVIYLTADSKNVLSELVEGKTYVIGGLVDHNQHKNLCLELAEEHEIQHAALPISQYVEMAARRVLTVNQCFDIMTKWLEYRDWEKAFFEVIPKRKYEQPKHGEPKKRKQHWNYGSPSNETQKAGLDGQQPSSLDAEGDLQTTSAEVP